MKTARSRVLIALIALVCIAGAVWGSIVLYRHHERSRKTALVQSILDRYTKPYDDALLAMEQKGIASMDASSAFYAAAANPAHETDPATEKRLKDASDKAIAEARVASAKADEMRGAIAAEIQAAGIDKNDPVLAEVEGAWYDSRRSPSKATLEHLSELARFSRP